jgi:hypothetical protein
LRSLRSSKKQLALPPRELEAVMFEQLRPRQAATASGMQPLMTDEDMFRLEANPKWKAACELSRALFGTQCSDPVEARPTPARGNMDPPRRAAAAWR